MLLFFYSSSSSRRFQAEHVRVLKKKKTRSSSLPHERGKESEARRLFGGDRLLDRTSIDQWKRRRRRRKVVDDKRNESLPLFHLLRPSLLFFQLSFPRHTSAPLRCWPRPE